MRPQVSILRARGGRSVCVRAPPTGARAEPLARLQAADGGVRNAGAPARSAALASAPPELRRVSRGALALATPLQLPLPVPPPFQKVCTNTVQDLSYQVLKRIENH